MTDWSAAACIGRPGLFHADDDETPRDRRYREACAVAICRTCPIRVDCALEGAGDPHGVWGGLTEADRRPPRDRTCAGCGTPLPVRWGSTRRPGARCRPCWTRNPATPRELTQP